MIVAAGAGQAHKALTATQTKRFIAIPHATPTHARR
jgi:hypothetical protein